MSTAPDSSGREIVPKAPHQPTSELKRQVRIMAACGMTPQQIALVLDITLRDFQRHYNWEYERGGLQATAEVGATVLSVAMDRAHPQFSQCAFFWLRSRSGWRDVRAVDTKQTTQAQMTEQDKQKLIDQILNQLVQPRQPEPLAERGPNTK